VTELIDRLKVSTTTLFGLPPSLADLDEEEQRILKFAGVLAVAVLWFAVALVEVWLLLALPLATGACVWLIRRRRALRVGLEPEPDDWSY
jgi:hypothetical protein